MLKIFLLVTILSVLSCSSSAFSHPILQQILRDVLVADANEHPHKEYDPSPEGRRRLDISQDCWNQTKQLWEEMTPIQWNHSFNFSYNECMEYPCNFQEHQHQNQQQHQDAYENMKQECEGQQGQFVQYRYRFRYNNGTTDQEREFFNVPECIGQSCDVTQFASYYQGYLSNQIENGLIDGISGEIYVISESSSPNKLDGMVGWTLVAALTLNVWFYVVM
jgi:hypothetical protein